MPKFKFKANIEFEAEDADEAIMLIIRHLARASNNRSSEFKFLGSIEYPSDGFAQDSGKKAGEGG